MFYRAPPDIKLKSIIVSRTDKIGDLILSIPAFATLRSMYPDATISVLVRNYNYDIVKSLPCIDEAIAIDSYSDDELKTKIRKLKADAFVALYSDAKVLKLCRMSQAAIKVGPLSKVGSFFVYSHGIRQRRSESVKNEAQYNLDLIKRLNTRLFDKCGISMQKINIDESCYCHIDAYLKDEHIDRFVLVHPFFGGSAKNYTTDEYLCVLKRLLALKDNIDIVVSAIEADAPVAKEMAAKLGPRAHVYISKGSILNLAALIDRCCVYVGGSTGPSHIAGNLKKKSVLIYPGKATQSPVRWGQYLNDKAIYIVPDAKEQDKDYSSNVFACVDKTLLENTALAISEAADEC